MQNNLMGPSLGTRHEVHYTLDYRERAKFFSDLTGDLTMRVTQRKFSEIVGVSKQRVGQWVRAGVITLDKNKKVDVDRARAELANRLDHSRRVDWEISCGRKIQPEEEYEVQKPFVEKIGGKKYLIPVGTVMRVYEAKKGIEIAFFRGKNPKEERS